MQKKYSVSGMSCAACASAVERAALSSDIVLKAEVNLLANTLTVTLPDSPTDDQPLYAAIEKAGYLLAPYAPPARKKEKKISFFEIRVLCSFAFLIPLFYIAMGKMLGFPLPAALYDPKTSAILQMLLLLPILLLNFGYFKRGYANLIKAHPNMDSLIALGTTASLGCSLYGAFVLLFKGETQVHLYFDSAGMILTLITLGKYLEARSKKKTGKAIADLLTLTPEDATVFKNGKWQTLPAESLSVGDLILVRPGGRIPADGKITKGSSSVDQSAMTGESIPFDVEPGDKVKAGTINLSGAIEFTAEKVAGDTTLAKMIELVEQASAGKAPVGRLADKVAAVFVPVVMTIALLAAGAWLFITRDFAKALEVGVSVLVIACPCSLGLATPAAIMAGTGKGAEKGIIFRSASALENCGKVDTVVFDKTGTLTEGHPVCTDILSLNRQPHALLTLACTLEAGSEHPIARAICQKGEEEKVAVLPCQNFKALPGRGVVGDINGKHYTVCSEKQLSKSDPAIHIPKDLLETLKGKTAVFILEEDKLLGAIGLYDQPKSDSLLAIKELQNQGLSCIMLSGDRKETAVLAGKEMGIDTVLAEVLPEEKEGQISALRQEGKRVAMVGDGINDAPALAGADIGFALSSGTDIAIESADVILMTNSVAGVSNAIALSKQTMRIIKQNLFFAFFYNSIGISLAVLGIANPMIGAAAMSLSSFCVLSNALRLRHFKGKGAFSLPQNNAVKNEDTCQSSCPINLENTSKKENNEMEKIIKIEGMMCPKCVAHVKSALEKVEGVTSVTVSLEKNNAVVTGTASPEALKTAIVDGGYEVVSIE